MACWVLQLVIKVEALSIERLRYDGVRVLALEEVGVSFLRRSVS